MKKIKKTFGDSFAKVVRDKFPIALEYENEFCEYLKNQIPCCGDIPAIFEKAHSELSKSFMMKIKGIIEEKKEVTAINPEILLCKIGYNILRIESKNQFLEFKKYYRSNEIICSYNWIDRMLSDCITFVIYRKNIDDIQPSTSPRREDDYGTSLMTVKISKNGVYYITNRYNHSVNNPDSTHSNNLNNIVGGLEDAIFSLPNMPKRGNQKVSLPDGIISDSEGRLFLSLREINAIHLSKNGYYKNGVIFPINRLYQRMYDDYLIDAMKKTAISVVTGNSLL